MSPRIRPIETTLTTAGIGSDRAELHVIHRLYKLFFGVESARVVPSHTECSRALAELSLDHFADDQKQKDWGKSTSQVIGMDTAKKKRKGNITGYRGLKNSSSLHLRVTPQSSRVNYSDSTDELYEALRKDFADMLNELSFEDKLYLESVWRYMCDLRFPRTISDSFADRYFITILDGIPLYTTSQRLQLAIVTRDIWVACGVRHPLLRAIWLRWSWSPWKKSSARKSKNSPKHHPRTR